MIVLYYSPHPDLALNSQTGYGTHMREMIRAFEEAGHEVDPLVMGGEGGQPGGAERASWKRRLKNMIKTVTPGPVWETLRDGALLLKDRQFEDKLEERVRHVQPDVIYERAGYLLRSGVRVANRYSIPHVLEVNSPLVEERKIRTPARTLLERKAHDIEQEQLRRTQVAAVVSPALREHFVQKHEVSAEKFLCTPNAIDPEKLSVDEGRVEAIRQQYDLRGQIVVGFVGSVIEWHRVDVLIRACKKMSEYRPDVTVLIVGGSTLVPELEALSEQLGIQNRVHFTGRVPHEDVFNFIEAMDITVLPDNLWYQSPVKLFEYGAMGKPIIAPDNATVRGLIRDEEEGILINADVGELVTAITTLIENDEQREAMAAAFQRKVLAEYTWTRNVERVLNAIAHQSSTKEGREAHS